MAKKPEEKKKDKSFDCEEQNNVDMAEAGIGDIKVEIKEECDEDYENNEEGMMFHKEANNSIGEFDPLNVETYLVQQGLWKNKSDHKVAVKVKKKQYKCQTCDYSTKNSFNLKRHQENVHGLVHHCDVPGCDFQTRQAGNIVGHKKVAHQGFRLPCSLCEKEFTSKQSLKTHVNVQHLGIRYSCDKCEFTLGTIAYLNTHIRVAHEGLTFACNINGCDFVTNDRSNLRVHKRNKHQQKPFKCKLQLHEENAEPTICGYQCTNRSEFLKHKADIHNMPSCVFICDKCNYQTTQSGHLKAHQQAKHEGKLFCCSECNFTSGFSSDLKRHIKKKHIKQEPRQEEVHEITMMNIPDDSISDIKSETPEEETDKITTMNFPGDSIEHVKSETDEEEPPVMNRMNVPAMIPGMGGSDKLSLLLLTRIHREV